MGARSLPFDLFDELVVQIHHERGLDAERFLVWRRFALELVRFVVVDGVKRGFGSVAAAADGDAIFAVDGADVGFDRCR